jgi:IclR family KDG regulon transcriptional repressor
MDQPGTNELANGVRVLDRVAAILDVLRSGPKSVTDVTAVTKLPKGTAFRLLTALGSHNLVIKDPATMLYSLGPGLIDLGQAAIGGMGALLALNRTLLQGLADRSQETVAIHIPIGLERLCLVEVPSPQAIRYVSGVGSLAPLSTGSAGRVLLAYMQPARRDRALDLLASGADDPESTRTNLQKSMERIRKDGFATSSGERVVGASAISVPVVGPAGLAALSVLGPSDRLTPERMRALTPAIREVAGTLEEGVFAATSTAPYEPDAASSAG